jgi:hypothetical protein
LYALIVLSEINGEWGFEWVLLGPT